ncbi:MAG: hypothetical protein QG657_1583 [Acidobacteriota bacterium]|nr:hypothetical protein [Acidobacteriota bacterium]
MERNLAEVSFTCRQCKRKVFLNSKPAVCAVIIKDNKVLLVRSHGRKSWDFPGGFLVYGEPPEEGLKRELKEELAAEIKIEGLVDAIVDVYGKYHDFSFNLFYKVSLVSSEIRPASEIAEYGWFDIDHYPAIAFKSTVDVLSVSDRYK